MQCLLNLANVYTKDSIVDDAADLYNKVIVLEPENLEELAKAINDLLSNKELCLEYGRNARERVKIRFDINKIQNEYTTLYEKSDIITTT